MSIKAVPFWQRWFQHKGNVILLITVLTVTVFSFMLNGSFKTVDDEISIVFNPLIRDVSSLPEILSSSFFGQGSFYRPLVMLSFMLDYAVDGLNPFVFHATNLMLHLFNAILVFYAVDRIIQSRNISSWTAILFAIHPIQWEAVSNIAGRSVLLSTLFSLLAWIAYMRWDKKGGGGNLLCVFIGQTAALLCKEAAVMLPVLFVWTSLFQGQALNLRKFNISIREAFGCLLKSTPFFLVVLIYLGLRHDLGIMNLATWSSWQEHVFSIITFLNGLLRYVGVYLMPVDLHFYRTQWLFNSWTSPALWGTIAVWLILFVQLWRTRRQWCLRVWFVLGFMAIELALIAQILTPLQAQPQVISLAEHLFYMPSIPILMFLVMCVRLLGNRYLVYQEKTSRWYVMAVCGWCCFMTGITAFMAYHATNELTMMKRAVYYEPWHNRNHFSLGLIYVKLQQWSKAEDHFRKALAFHPREPRALIALARVMVEQGRVPEALTIYKNLKQVPLDLRPLLAEHITYAEQILLEKP